LWPVCLIATSSGARVVRKNSRCDAIEPEIIVQPTGARPGNNAVHQR
jgi:hypothetical protein